MRFHCCREYDDDALTNVPPPFLVSAEPCLCSGAKSQGAANNPKLFVQPGVADERLTWRAPAHVSQYRRGQKALIDRVFYKDGLLVRLPAKCTSWFLSTTDFRCRVDIVRTSNCLTSSNTVSTRRTELHNHVSAGSTRRYLGILARFRQVQGRAAKIRAASKPFRIPKTTRARWMRDLHQSCGRTPVCFPFGRGVCASRQCGPSCDPLSFSGAGSGQT